MNITIRFNHWVANPLLFFGGKKKGFIYGRVVGNTIYFTCSKITLLRNAHGRYVHRALMRHELEHFYQKQRYGALKFNLIYWEEILVQWVRHLFNPWAAYYYNRFEVEARAAGKNNPLTQEEIEIFLNAQA